MFLTAFPLTGLLGIDHLVLRSPITGLLKFLSLIPTLGFWYFYDIAQAIGERELVEKNGIGVPFYGPLGIGAGMFSGSEGVSVSPKEVPRPWLYMAYVITTCLFVAFPINKFVVGDYTGALAQIIMYILFPLSFLAIIWGFYDIYRVLFDTKSLIEKGPARFFPAPYFIGEYFNRSVLGPLPKEPDTGLLARFDIIESIAEAATIGVVGLAAKEAQGRVQEVSDVASGTIQSAKIASDAVTGTVEHGAKAAEGIASLVEKIPEIGIKVASDLADPTKIIEQAKKGAAVEAFSKASQATAQATQGIAQTSQAVAQTSQALAQAPSAIVGQALKQAGGANSPPLSTAVLLFSVGLVAFSGYVFYMFRNTYKKPEKTDDPPPNPRTVRVPSEADRS